VIRLRARSVAGVLTRRPRIRSRAVAALVAALALVAACCAAACAPALAGTDLSRPVPGRVTRPFDLGPDPFASGQHRGIDLAAAPGDHVGAPCAGRVVAAGRIGASGRVVTVACGPWHATVMPLARVDVRRGAHVAAGRVVGTAAASAAHTGLHLGVRRARERFGYVDPLRLLRTRRPWPLVAPPPGRAARRSGRPPHARGLRPHAWRAPATPRTAITDAGLPIAPWPAWAGAALVLAGSSAGGGLIRRRRRLARARALPAMARLATTGGHR
jgi:hypothetical protein